MKQITNFQDLKTTVDANVEMVITVNGNNVMLMEMEEYMNTILKKDIEENLLKAEDNIENGRTRDARRVFKEWKEQYGI